MVVGLADGKRSREVRKNSCYKHCTRLYIVFTFHSSLETSTGITHGPRTKIATKCTLARLEFNAGHVFSIGELPKEFLRV